MRFIPPESLGKEPQKKASSRRRFGRLPQETLMSNIGPVLDVSAGGMRILCRKVPKDKVEITLADNDLPGKLCGEVTWSKRVGLFKYEIGVRFDNVSQEVAQRLTVIAGANRLRRVM